MEKTKTVSGNSRSNDRSFSRYYEEVGRTQMLNSQEELELFLAYRDNGDLSARDKIIHNCLRSVVKIAHRYSKNPDQVKDLISAGNLGIMDALSRYDPTKNTRFLSYATYWIQLHIRNEMYNADIVCMPLWRQKAIRRIKKVKNVYEQHGSSASAAQICKEADVSPNQLKRLDAGQLRFANLELIASALKDQNTDIARTVTDTETKQILSSLVRTLPVKEQFVIRAYFGVITEPMSLKQIASVLAVSSERVRQIKVIALSKLHRTLKRMSSEDIQDALTTA